jgi:phage tail sheath protein FI
MANTYLLSPGVLARENDQSFLTERPIAVGAAIVGPTVKGPVELPTIVRSYSDFQNKFGTVLYSGSSTYTYITSIAAYNYFQNGGDTLLVARVVSGSGTDWTPATSSAIPTQSSGVGFAANPFILETLSEGIIMNNTLPVQTAGGVLPSGSVDNVRFEIVGTNTSSGVFTLLIRRGDDTSNSKIVLESWTNLSLDPFSPNFISKVIGDYVLNYNSTTNQIEVSGSYPNASRYVRVKAVNAAMPNYLNSNGTANAAFTASMPQAGTSGTFGAAIGNNISANMKFYDQIDGNIQGLTGSDYNNMINLLSNVDDYKFNVLLTPGLTDANAPSQVTSIISNTQDRGDSIYVLDLVNYNSSVSSVISAGQSRDTSYAASYWPWVQVVDPDLGKNVWVPASTVIGGVYAFNDKVAEPWFAPAGINRGGLGTVIRAERKLNSNDRDDLYQGKVNPIATFPSSGVVVYGQKTLQNKPSALDRVNVRRLLISLKSYISQVALNLVFEQNTVATRNNFLAQVNPYLESVQQRQGLYAFRVIMNESNNTADVIDRNELVGAIYLQPTKTAEFIYLDFNITPTGATFPS